MMRSTILEVVLKGQAGLAESPWWDSEHEELLWVDIFSGAIHALNPGTGQDKSFNVGQPVGMVCGRSSGGLLCGVRDGIAFVDRDGLNFTVVAQIEKECPGNRINDGACDSKGRLWVGTMASDLTSHQGALYRVGPHLSVERKINAVSISNGLDWGPDGETFYYTDSLTRRIDVYDFDAESGNIENRRALVSLPDPVATPDGMAVDDEGTLWVAMWDGSCIRRYSPKGKLLETINLPVTRVTSVAFGGPGMEYLFITSARCGLTEQQLENEPLAGSIFALRTGSAGYLPNRFAG